MLDWIKGSKQVIVNRSQEISVLSELQVYIIVIGVAALFMLLLGLTYLVICCDKNIGRYFKEYVNGFMWNGYIRF
jgi:Na+/H+-dicarboxylate symporter